MIQIIAVPVGGVERSIPRQAQSLAHAKAIAWECWEYDQASGNPECADYQVRTQETVDISEEQRQEDIIAILYSAVRDGQPLNRDHSWEE